MGRVQLPPSSVCLSVEKALGVNCNRWASHFVFVELKIRASTSVFVQLVILMVLFATY